MTRSNAAPHIPIMVGEVLKSLEGAELRIFFDGTLGAGGHAKAILEAHPEIERYIGCDKDPEALEIARKNLEPWAHKVVFVHGDFSKLDEYLNELNVRSVDGFFLTSECHLCS
jgi:16S rRNA (cytosine1402-N4)-methyltransferase